MEALPSAGEEGEFRGIEFAVDAEPRPARTNHDPRLGPAADDARPLPDRGDPNTRL
jgi:hypothetical protein